MGDYKKAIELLKNKKKDREDYLWLLEALYWSGEDMSGTLSEVAKLYPDLYKEYQRWESFRRGDWLGALGFFEDPYYKALALYNLKKYKEVIDLLQGRTDERSRLIKARSALMMDDTKLARSFLTGKSEEEFYLLGLSYFLEGNYQKAVEFFEKVPANNPNRAKALLKMGESYYNMGKADKAKDSYFEVLRSFPDSEEARSAIEKAEKTFISPVIVPKRPIRGATLATVERMAKFFSSFGTIREISKSRLFIISSFFIFPSL